MVEQIHFGVENNKEKYKKLRVAVEKAIKAERIDVLKIPFEKYSKKFFQLVLIDYLGLDGFKKLSAQDFQIFKNFEIKKVLDYVIDEEDYNRNRGERSKKEIIEEAERNGDGFYREEEGEVIPPEPKIGGDN